MYIGDQNHAMNEDILRFLKITHVINVTMHVKNVFEDKGVKYLNIRIDDTPEYQIGNYFESAFNYIEDALSTYSELEIHKNISFGYSRSMTSELDIVSSIKSLGINENENLKEIMENTNNWTKINKIIQLIFKSIYRKYASNHRILIHCSLGCSRSPTIAIMYVMKKFQLPFQNAYEFIKFQRDRSTPINSFIDELEQFEKNGFNFI
jgi:protein-tyrosine phosphatase